MSSVNHLQTRAKTSTPAMRIIRNHNQKQAVAQLWYFLGSLLALLAIFRIVDVASRRLFKAANVADTSSREKPSEQAAPVRTGKVSLRRLPAAFGAGFRIIAFRVVVPIGLRAIASVTEVTFVVGYIVANFLWLLINTDNLNSIFYQDRAGLIASCQIPLVIALAGKNNIISFVTGVGHEKLNVLHRASARTLLILLWMHAITRTYNVLPAQFDYSHGWMRWGAAGLVAFSLATALSLRAIRDRAFEFFLVSHIVLILVFLISGFIHMKYTGYEVFVWPGLIIWGLDRALRLGRVLKNNRVWSPKDETHATATVELLSEDTVRLTLLRRFDWSAGQHAYVVLPGVSTLPFEAHPFTIANIPQPLDGSKGPANRNVVFLIRGRSGFTNRLRDHTKGNRVGVISALVDGPYGYPPDLRSYSTVILVSGGSGVSYTLPLLMDVVRNANTGNTNARRVVFVWTVRNGSHLNWISTILDEAVAAAPSWLQVDRFIFITGVNSEIPSMAAGGQLSPTISSENDHKGDSVQSSTHSTPKISTGRPDIQRILEEEITLATGRVSVDVAGPSGLARSVRRSLRSDFAGPGAVLRGMSSVDLHVETFGMSNK